MRYGIEYLETVIRKDIPGLAKTARQRIKRAIERRLTTNPVELGQPLRYNLKGARRLPVGDYRVIYKIEPPQTVLIVKIGHRKEVHED